MDSRRTKAQEKRRSNERRKEKSRDAARCRRSRETDVFTNLAEALPVTPKEVAHLDKASVMRLAIAYLKVRSVIDALEEPVTKCPSLAKMDALFPEALGGFMLVLSKNGDMVYLSDNVSDYLGVTQMEMMGQSVYEYSHPCDHDELRECLSMRPSDVMMKQPCNFFLRLKCTLTNKGRKVNLKSASYKVIHCTGRALGAYERKMIKTNKENSENSFDDETSESSFSKEEEDGEEEGEDEDTEAGTTAAPFDRTGASLVVVGSPIPHPSNIEIPLGRQTFLSKHSLSMKFTYADERLAEYLGWASNELLGKSVFEFHHALDNSTLVKSFKSLFSKGQCETMAYRFLNKKGGYAWVLTQATLIHCSRQHKPLSVVCVNHILSGVERENEVYSERQLEARRVNVESTKEARTAPLSSKSIKEKRAATIEHFKNEESPSLSNGRSSLTEAIGEEESIGTPPTVSISNENDDSGDAIDNNDDDDTRNRRVESCYETKERAHPGDLRDVAFPAIRERIEARERKALRPTERSNNSYETRDSLTRPLTVTASIFRSQADIASQDSLSKDLPPLVPETIANTEQTDRRGERVNWLFQDKPILEYEPSVRNVRPQTVTKNVFAPLASLIPDQESLSHLTCRPHTSTASIFAPRTEDMNKGFLTFSDDQPGLTMLKDEPEDLTHLAPTPGDVCVPLEDAPFFSDMLDEFILGNENYCPLLGTSEDLPTELPNAELNADCLTRDNGNEICCGTIESSLTDSDPFIYRDIPSPCSLSPDLPGLLSPSGIGKSPDRGGLGSFRSPRRNEDAVANGVTSIETPASLDNSITEDEMLMLSINDAIGDEELAQRAPYIPMSDQDEALQLLISDDTVMWGPSQPSNKKAKWNQEAPRSNFKRHEDSNLARLLINDARPSKYKDHGGGDGGGGFVDPCQIFVRSAEKGNIAKGFERPSKRVHAPIVRSSSPGENKRGRFNNDAGEATAVKRTIDGGPPILGRDGTTSVLSENASRERESSPRRDETAERRNGRSGGGLSFADARNGGQILLQQLIGREDGILDVLAVAPLLTKNFHESRGANEATTPATKNLLKIVTKNGVSAINAAAGLTEDKEKIGFAGDGGGTLVTGVVPGHRGKVGGGGADGGGTRQQQQQQQQQQRANSVLMNLLVSGCDVSAGYVCLAKPKVMSTNSISTK